MNDGIDDFALVALSRVVAVRIGAAARKHECLLPVEMLFALFDDVITRIGIVNPFVDVNVDAADSVDQIDQAFEVDFSIMVDRNAR